MSLNPQIAANIRDTTVNHIDGIGLYFFLFINTLSSVGTKCFNRKCPHDINCVIIMPTITQIAFVTRHISSCVSVLSYFKAITLVEIYNIQAYYIYERKYTIEKN